MNSIRREVGGFWREVGGFWREVGGFWREVGGFRRVLPRGWNFNLFLYFLIASSAFLQTIYFD
jgi:hypothetical protein